MPQYWLFILSFQWGACFYDERWTIFLWTNSNSCSQGHTPTPKLNDPIPPPLSIPNSTQKTHPQKIFCTISPNTWPPMLSPNCPIPPSSKNAHLLLLSLDWACCCAFSSFFWSCWRGLGRACVVATAYNFIRWVTVKYHPTKTLLSHRPTTTSPFIRTNRP